LIIKLLNLLLEVLVEIPLKPPLEIPLKPPLEIPLKPPLETLLEILLIVKHAVSPLIIVLAEEVVKSQKAQSLK
jgi:hypothetical protein